MNKNNKLHNPSANDILRKEFLVPLALTPHQLASRIQMPLDECYEIIFENREITKEIDRKLCDYFHLSEGYFLRLQKDHDDF